MIIDIIGWIALVTGMLGLWLSGKHRWGWFFNAAAGVPWVIVGVATGVWAIVVNTIIFSIISLRNYAVWSKRHPGK